MATFEQVSGRRVSWLTVFVLVCLAGYCSAVCSDLQDGVISIEENSPVGTYIANVTADSLAAVNTNQGFLVNVTQVNPGFWEIYVQGNLDAETLSSTEVRLNCKDVGIVNYQTVTFTIILKDVNEYAPQFEDPDFTLNIEESVENGTRIYTMKAYDLDTDGASIFKFEIIDGDDGYFQFANDLFGYITLIKPLDYEKGPTNFTLNISATEYSQAQLGKTNFTTLFINVKDVDNHMPEFLNYTYSLSVQEGDYTSTRFFETSPVLSARDGDSYINQTIQFRIGQGTEIQYGQLFTVTLNGSIGITGNLNTGTYSVLIEAYQTDKPQLRYSATIVTITVMDVNNHKPEMDSKLYPGNISETASPETIILTVTAHDEDLGNNSVFKFQLGSAANGIFTVENYGPIGVIKLISSLNRKQKNYVFEVWAEETLTKEHWSSMNSTVNITVLDENDNTPKFNQPEYSFQFKIPKTKGDFVGQVFATDLDDDINGEVTYTIQLSTLSLSFVINNNTGEITLNKNVTLSEVGSYYLIVCATDRAVDVDKRRTSFATVVVDILRDNLNPPIFVTDPYIFNVSETATSGTLVGQVTANDADGDVIHYSMPGNKYLLLDSTTGEITLSVAADLDSNSSSPTMNLDVNATDGLHSTRAYVKIVFLYENEYPPLFELHGLVTIFENDTEDTLITKVKANDKDKGSDGNVTYSLIPTTTSVLFKIDHFTGEIRLNCSSCLNYSNYDIIVQATDGGRPPFQNTMSVPLKVEKTEFQQPHFSQKYYHVLLPENSQSQIVLQLLATDSDTPSQQLQFSSTNQNTASPLKIFENGTVYMNGTFDADVQNYFVEDVSVTDGHSFGYAQIEVNITDLNDNFPILNITASQPVLLLENSTVGTFVVAVGATDKDITNSGFYFFLTEGADGKFYIDINTGLITLTGHLDRKRKSSYNITVIVLDHGSPPNLGSGNQIVEVTDSNTAPYFVNASKNQVSRYDFTVAEDMNIGELIGTLYAFDPDSGSSGHVTFKLQSGDSSSTFLLENKGNLTLARSLNFETRQTYTLIAVVSDNSFEPKSSSAVVRIYVTNVEEAPEWPQPLPTVYITQSSICKNQQQQLQAFSKEVTTVSSNGNASIEYKLLNMTNEFSINHTSGLLQINNTLSVGFHYIGLTACLRGSNVCSNATLPVVVKNEDIFAFCPAYYTVDVNESSTINFSFLDLNTTKSDLAVNYNISLGNMEGKFGIGENDGKLYISNQLDRETTPSYVLLITAKDTTNHEEAEAQVTIRVLDALDEQPTFLATVYQGEILESVAKGSPVFIPFTNTPLTVTAVDRDLYYQLSYSIDLTRDTSNGSFNITTGATIVLEKQVDYETIPGYLNKSYTFTVLVSNGILNDSATVVVHILDDNDNPPSFVNPDNVFLNITEGTVLGEALPTISATDPDTNTKLIYSLSAISPAGAMQYFGIDVSSGKLDIIQELDRETEDEYILNVTVTDGKFITFKTVTVKVLDANDEIPTFIQTFYMTVIEGTAGLGTNISVTAYDNDTDLNAVLTYFIVAGNANHNFDFEQNILKTVSQLDRESIVHNGVANITLIITAVDNGKSPKTGTGTVIVTVADVNDNPPQFSSNRYTAYISEDTINETVILSPLLTVTDVDSGECPNITFKLSNSSTPFIINEDTGALFVSHKLDRETDAYYNFWITATDDCGTGLNSSAEIFIKVTDVNDEALKFSQPVYNFYISENSTFFSVVGIVTATDADTIEAHLTYRLNSTNMFDIHPLTGEIILFGDLNRENGNGYVLNVSACENKTQCSYATVYIHVTSVSDKCPTWNMTSLNLSVIEGQDPGPIGYVSAVYKNISIDSVVIYFLNDTEGMKYLEINNSGEVTLLRKLSADKLDETFFSFSIYAEDYGQLPCILPGTLKINVTGVNNNNPEICYQGLCGRTDIEVTVYDQSPENTLVAQISARDNDTGADGKVTLNLTSKEGGPADPFSLNESGIIFLNKKIILADLQNDTVDLILLAKDNGQDTQFSNTSIKVKIVTSTSGVPIFDKPSFKLTVRENQNSGASVGNVHAISTSNASLNYSISVPVGILPFQIDEQGTITTTLDLDRETVESYLFTVQATNPSPPKITASALVFVTVEDVNEPPMFYNQVISVKAKEETAPEYLLTLIAHDDDAGVNGTITYNLLNALSYTNFELNSSTGVLSVISSLDRKLHPSYDLIIQAVDGGKPQLTANVTVHITVIDINNNAPEFTETSYECNITKSDLRVKILTVTATDADEGLNKKISYSLESDFGVFKINSQTGEIHTFQVPSTNFYTLVVIATDYGTPPLNSTVDVFVRVMDNRQDIEPFLSLSTNSLPLFVGMTAGTELGVTITTKDVDILSISGVNVTDIFELLNEKITLSQDLILVTVYVLNITAKSSTSHIVSQELVIHVDKITFSQQSYAAAVTENSNVHQTILDINSYAENIGIPVVYSLLDHFHSTFFINSSTGVLWVLKALDREEFSVYVLNVSLSLDHLHLHSRRKRAVNTDQALASVQIRVKDQNDNVPSFDNIGPELLLTLLESVNDSYLITTLKAFDPDEGYNGLIRYSISGDDSDAFQLDPVNGELKVASHEKLKNHLPFKLTVQAADNNGTGSNSSLKILISIVQDSYQFRLSTPLPVSILKKNQKAILERLSQILGFSLINDEVIVHEEFGVVYADRSDILFQAYVHPSGNTTTYMSASQIEKKVSDQQAEIEKLFKSFIIQPEKDAQKEDALNTASKVLIAVACFMLLVTLVTIIIACRMWRRQQKYEQNKKKDVNIIYEMENLSKVENVKKINLYTNTDEHKETTVLSEVSISTASVTTEIQEETVDHRLQQMQRSLQFLASESKDSAIAFPPNSDGNGRGPGSPTSVQESVEEEGEEEASSSSKNDAIEKGEGSSDLLDNGSRSEVPNDTYNSDKIEKREPEAVPIATASPMTQDDSYSLSTQTTSFGVNSILPSKSLSNGGIFHHSDSDLSNDEPQDTGKDTINNSIVPTAIPNGTLGLSFVNKAFQSRQDEELSGTDAVTYF